MEDEIARKREISIDRSIDDCSTQSNVAASDVVAADIG